jgi:hypothetical protein
MCQRLFRQSPLIVQKVTMVWWGTALLEQFGAAFGDGTYLLKTLLNLALFIQTLSQGNCNCVRYILAGQLRQLVSQLARLFVVDGEAHWTSCAVSSEFHIYRTPLPYAVAMSALVVNPALLLPEFGGYVLAEHAKGCHYLLAGHEAAVSEHQVADAGVAQGGDLLGHSAGRAYQLLR